jgi:hypothetical protein
MDSTDVADVAAVMHRSRVGIRTAYRPLTVMQSIATTTTSTTSTTTSTSTSTQHHPADLTTSTNQGTLHHVRGRGRGRGRGGELLLPKRHDV